MVKIINLSGITIIFIDVFKGYELFVPLTYEEMVASKTYPLTKNEMGEYVSYDKSVIWKENSKIEDTEEMKKFKNAASQLDRFFGSLFLNQMMKYIVKRFNLYYIYGDYKLISIWPGQKILNPNYKLEGENVKYGK